MKRITLIVFLLATLVTCKKDGGRSPGGGESDCAEIEASFSSYPENLSGYAPFEVTFTVSVTGQFTSGELIWDVFGVGITSVQYLDPATLSYSFSATYDEGDYTATVKLNYTQGNLKCPSKIFEKEVYVTKRPEPCSIEPLCYQKVVGEVCFKIDVEKGSVESIEFDFQQDYAWDATSSYEPTICVGMPVGVYNVFLRALCSSGVYSETWSLSCLNTLPVAPLIDYYAIDAKALSGDYKGGKLYIANGSGGVVIADWSETLSPKITLRKTLGEIRDVKAERNRDIFYATGPGGTYAMRGTDVIATIGIPGDALEIFEGEPTYVVIMSDKLYACNVEAIDLVPPKFVCPCSFNLGANDIELIENPEYRLFATSKSKIIMLTLSRESEHCEFNLRSEKTLEEIILEKITTSGNWLYVTSGEKTLEIFEYSEVDITLHHRGSKQMFPDESLDIVYDAEASGNTVIVSKGKFGNVVLDISTPDVPDDKGTVETSSTVLNFTKGGGYFFAFEGLRGVESIDIAEPRVMSKLALNPTPTPEAPSIATYIDCLNGELKVFLALGDAGLEKLDVSEALSKAGGTPEFIANIQPHKVGTPLPVRNVIRWENSIFVVYGSNDTMTVRKYDTSFGSPQLIGYLDFTPDVIAYSQGFILTGSALGFHYLKTGGNPVLFDIDRTLDIKVLNNIAFALTSSSLKLWKITELGPQLELEIPVTCDKITVEEGYTIWCVSSGKITRVDVKNNVYQISEISPALSFGPEIVAVDISGELLFIAFNTTLGGGLIVLEKDGNIVAYNIFGLGSEVVDMKAFRGCAQRVHFIGVLGEFDALWSLRFLSLTF